jgi:hypothetical protein
LANQSCGKIGDIGVIGSSGEQESGNGSRPTVLSGTLVIDKYPQRLPQRPIAR